MDRVILHCDMNSFFASVELLDHPELQDKPAAVCGNQDKRHGIILAKNEIAKKYGVITGETTWAALKKCPHLEFLKPHMSKYKEFSKKINEIYFRFTDMVEPFSIDESWLDVTASQKLFGSGKEIADTIRKTVKEELGLTLSAGVSYNKIFAKMGSDYKKPDATTEITRENYKTILWPMSAGELFFVGKATAEKLASIGVSTIGEIAQTSPKVLEKLLGKQGLIIWQYANGYDESPVSLFTNQEPVKSIGNGITFSRDLINAEDILTAVKTLSDTVAVRLRKSHNKAFGIKVDIKDNFFKTISRQKQLDIPTNLAEEISDVTMELILSNWKIGVPIRLLTITGINLIDEKENVQLSMFTEENENHQAEENLERTMDLIRSKFGSEAVGFATTLDNDIGAYVRIDDVPRKK